MSADNLPIQLKENGTSVRMLENVYKEAEDAVKRRISQINRMIPKDGFLVAELAPDTTGICPTTPIVANKPEITSPAQTVRLVLELTIVPFGEDLADIPLPERYRG